MIEQVNQCIDVLVAFVNRRVLPLSFTWNKKKYAIDKVNLIHESRQNGAKWYHFSLSSGGGFYKIAFDTEHNLWFLQEADFGY